MIFVSSLEILKRIFMELLAVTQIQRARRAQTPAFYLTQILNVVLEHFRLVFCLCSWFLVFSVL